MRRPFLSLVFVVGCGLAGAACGGSSDGPPPPLGRHFQDSYIASQPVDQQGDIIKAQNDFNVAQREKSKAEADLRESQLMVDVARNEAKAAQLDEQSAQSNMKAAQASADTNRINDATREKRGAELAKNASDERVKYYSAYRDWLKRLHRYTEENTYWRESQYELAKAKLAQKNNIAPAGFNHDDYVKQEADRSKRSESSRRTAEELRNKAAEARDRWLAIQGQADKTLGKTSQFPDPMSTREIPSNDPTSGAGGTTIGGGSDASPTDSE